jgi:ADP-ribose pyrophosphatase YjhB (NUDIX family)
MSLDARIRATSYITRTAPDGMHLLVFDYPSQPDAGTHLPGGGVDQGERPDVAAIREAVEETGVTGRLDLLGVVGVQQGTHDTGQPYVSVAFHFASEEPRDHWTHTMIGDDSAWDTGLEVRCRFVPLTDAAPLLRTSWFRPDEFLARLHC